MKDIVYIGIDPGKEGAMAIINKKTVIIIPFNEEEYKKALQRYSKNNKCVCIVENVHSMPGQGVKSTFNFGKNFGYILGLLDSLDIPYKLVAPLKWKNFYKLTGKPKQASIDLVHKKFKNINLKRTPRKINDDDNIAEAILLAEYGKNI